MAMSDTRYDVRIIECHGRRRKRIEIMDVTKEDALVQAGACLIAGRRAGEGGTWVQPRIVSKRREPGAQWVDQSFDVNRKAQRAFMAWLGREQARGARPPTPA